MELRILVTSIVLRLAVITGSSSLEIPRYDGYYNNVANPAWGTPGTHLYRKIPAAYSDGTHAYPDGPNERLISQYAMSGPSGLPSYKNRTSFLALFGQFVSLETIKGFGPGCPRELTPMVIPKCDPDYDPKCTGKVKTSFNRAKFDQHTGQSPGSPREQINGVSSFIDGSVIYSNSIVRLSQTRSFKDGKLRTLNEEGLMPPLNDKNMPVLNLPPPREHKLYAPERQWLTGDGRLFQHPAMLAFYVIFMRYHNLMATHYKTANPAWDDETIFQAARRRVIAVQQKIFAYDFYPAFNNDALDPYTGYKDYVHPGVSHLYQSAAFRFGHTIVPPGFYRRDAKCNFYTTTEKTHEPGGYPAVRMCNTWFHGDEAFEYGLEPLLLGMASQITEREDHILNEDVRGKVFGPLQHSRRDLTALNIKRGRDNGFLDYNTARKLLGLKPKTNFSDINPWLYARDPKAFKRLSSVYDGNINNVDIFVGGLFESTQEGPGELFKLIIRDQFTRFRDGDRFWFENKINEFFTDTELAEIYNTTLYSIILDTTSIKAGDVQENVFFWKQGDPCEQPKQLNGSDLSECNANKAYDYFSGSETGFIVIVLGIFILIIGCFFVPIFVLKLRFILRRGRFRSWEHSTVSNGSTAEKHFASEDDEVMEYHDKDKWRHVRVTFLEAESSIVVQDKSGNILRNINLGSTDMIVLQRATDSRKYIICLKVKIGPDLVLCYKRPDDIKSLADKINKFTRDRSLLTNTAALSETKILSKARNLKEVMKEVEYHCRFLFAELLGIEIRSDVSHDLINKDILQVELSRHELAEATRLRTESEFVQLIYDTLDSERSGCLKLRKILAFLVLLCDVPSKKKLKALFDMYDIEGRGKVKKMEFLKVIRTIEEIANSRGDEMLLEAMLASADLDQKQELSFDDLLKLSENDDTLQDNMERAFGRFDSSCIPDTQRSSISRPMTVPKFHLRPGTSSSQRVSSASTYDKFEKATRPVSSRKTGVVKWYNSLMKTMTNYQQRIHVVLLFYLITLAVFIERFQAYATNSEHSGIRRLTGYGVPVTRGSASAMSFTYSIAMLSMCKNTINAFRNTRLANYIPFDSALTFHMITAYTSVFLSVVHVIGHVFNFYHLTTQPPDFVECIFKNMIWFRSDFLPSFAFYIFKTATGLTGFLLILALSILVAFSTPWVRHRMYSVFLLSHRLLYVIYALIILHGSAVLVQQPWFHFFFLGPATLFTCDKLYGMKRKLSPLPVLFSEHMPSDVLHLRIKRPPFFDYVPGQYAQVACDEISSRQFHPFTITSYPDEKFLSFHIRSFGPWTTALSELMATNRQPLMYVDGPYGGVPGAFHKYEVSVMAAGGIGVTAFSAILKQLLSDITFKSKRVKKIYFIWSTCKQSHWEWFVDVLREIEEVDVEGVIDIHLFITNHFEKYDLRTLLMFLSEKHLISMSDGNLLTGLQSVTHFGRPDYSAILDAISCQHPEVTKFGVFACGPSIMSKTVRKACSQHNGHSDATFDYYDEIFNK